MTTNSSTYPETTIHESERLKEILDTLDEGEIAVFTNGDLAEEVRGDDCTTDPPVQPTPPPSPDLIVRARHTSILATARRLGLGLPEMRDKSFYVECPWHRDEGRSLRLDRSDGLWECEACGRLGDGIELVRRTLRLGYAEVIRWIAGKLSVSIGRRVTAS